MKKWHLEGVLNIMASPKLTLPAPGQVMAFHRFDSTVWRKDSRFVSRCRSVAAFLIRSF